MVDTWYVISTEFELTVEYHSLNSMQISKKKIKDYA